MSTVAGFEDDAFSLRPNISQWSAQSNEQGGYQLVYKPSSFGDKFQNFLASAEGGPFRFLQLADKVCGLLSFLKSESQFKAAAKIFNGGWTMTIVPQIPASIQSVTEAVVAAATPSPSDSLPGFFRRKCVGAVQEVTGFISTISHATNPFLSLSKKTAVFGSHLLKISQFTTLASDLCEFQKSREDLAIARTMLERAERLDSSQELIAALKDTSKLHLLKTAKVTCSLSGMVLSAALGVTGLSKSRGSLAFMAAVSLLGTVISTATGLYKEGMKYKPVNFFDTKRVVQMVKVA